MSKKQKGDRSNRRDRNDRRDRSQNRCEDDFREQTERRDRMDRIAQKHLAATKVNQQRVESKLGPRTENQAAYIHQIQTNTITLVIGPAGTGKTYLAIGVAVQELVRGTFKKIILTRPAVEAAGEKLGALPGDPMEKLNPYMIPLYDSLEKLLGKMEVERLMELGIIEVVPLAYMRGRTLEDAVIIMDEAQNASPEQVKMMLTRLGARSKMVITGDLAQSDIPSFTGGKKRRNGLEDAVLRFSDVEGIAVVLLKISDIQRHPLVGQIIKMYEKVRIPDEMNIEDIYKHEEPSS